MVEAVRPAPVATLLSQALVAYTIEFDDEAEQRVPHGTTVGGHAGMRAGGVWFTSQVMWTNFVRHLSSEGRTVGELQALACLSEKAIKTRLHHLEWWSYLTLVPSPSETRAKPRYRDLVVKLTANGVSAANAWAPIAGEIDKRWTKRFGKAQVDALARALRPIVTAEAAAFPDYLPVVDYGDGMRATLTVPDDMRATPVGALEVSGLLSRALLALTLEFEKTSAVSLTASADVLRVLEDGMPLKDIPLHAGVAKEGVVALVNFLDKNSYVSLSAEKAKVVTPTAKGRAATDDHHRMLAAIEKRWDATLGKSSTAELRRALEAIVTHPKFIDGLRPHDASWRWNKRYVTQTEATLAAPLNALPHHPMITHRGGFPDGC